jgi:hypothetical protein
MLAEGLALLRAVDAAEADTLRVSVVQDFDGVTVEDGHDLVRDSSALLHCRWFSP